MAASKSSRKESVKSWLDARLLEFNQPEFLKNDPVGIVHEYKGKENQEFVALMASLFAFGNARLIRRIIRDVLKPLQDEPAKNLLTIPTRDIEKIWANLYYRFYTPRDIQNLLKALQRTLKDHKNFESAYLETDRKNHLHSLLNFRNLLIQNLPSKKISRGLKFMLSNPETGAAKRWHLFLRWVVRKDEIDLGLWSHIKPSEFIQPLDTHLFQIGRKLKLISRKTASLAAALEMTESFKEWSPEDPIRYDFALCQIGIQGLREQETSKFKP